MSTTRLHHTSSTPAGAGGRGWARLLGVGWLLLLAAAGAAADGLPLPSAPDLLRAGAAPLTPGHLLGTDLQGQDVLRSLVFGARTALLVSVPTAVLAATLGTLLGVGAGYWGNTRLRLPLSWVGPFAGAGALFGLVGAPAGSMLAVAWPLFLAGAALALSWGLSSTGGRPRYLALPADAVVSGALVFLSGVPLLLLVVVAAAAVAPTTANLVGLLALTLWVPTARLMRAEAKRVRMLPYLQAASSLGLQTWRIMGWHVLPNTWQVVRVAFPLSLAGIIGLETTLSFLGVGLPPETPSWGRVLAAGRLAPELWWLIVFPSLALLGTVLALRQLVAPRRKAAA